MSIEQWRAKLQPATKELLIGNNGDVVPPAVVAEIAQAGGPASDDSWWASQSESPAHYLPDAIDWVETTANDEPAE